MNTTPSPLCPNLVDDVLLQILGYAGQATCGLVLLTCKRARANPAHVFSRLSTLVLKLRSSFSAALFPFLPPLKNLEISDYYFTWSKVIASPILATRVQLETGVYSNVNKILTNLEQTQALSVMCRFTRPNGFLHLLAQHTWPKLEEFEFDYERTGAVYGPITELMPCQFPKLKRLKITCLCQFELHNTAIWSQLESIEADICKNCHSEYNKLDVGKFELANMPYARAWELNPTRLSQLNKRALEHYRLKLIKTTLCSDMFYISEPYEELLRLLQTQITWELTPDQKMVALQYLRKPTTRDEFASYMDIICNSSAHLNKLEFNLQWLTRFDWKQEWMLRILSNPEIVKKCVFGCQYMAHTLISEATKVGISQDVIKHYIRQAIRLGLDPKEEDDEQVVLWLHRTMDIHDLCGTLYLKLRHQYIESYTKLIMRDLQKEINSRVELATEFPAVLQQKLQHFITTKLKARLQMYHCDVCTTCKHV